MPGLLSSCDDENVAPLDRNRTVLGVEKNDDDESSVKLKKKKSKSKKVEMLKSKKVEKSGVDQEIAKHPVQVTSQPDTEEKVTVAKLNLPTINLSTSTTQFTEIKARCQFCPKAFAGQEFLEKHIAAKHPEMVAVEKGLVTEFQCDQCQKFLGSKSALKNHMPLHLEEKPFKCEHCGKEFSQSGNLRIHVKRYHTNQEHEGIDI